ncbi:MAG: FG-GAP repeat domain-containing protein [Pyrinomonadaceae bacterium]
MVAKNSHLKQKNLLISISIICLVLLIALVFVVAMPTQQSRLTSNLSSTRLDQDKIQSGTEFDPYKYLPVGSTITNPNKDVVFADLDGDKRHEVIIFYGISNTNMSPSVGLLVLKLDGTEYSKQWEKIYDFGVFGEPSGVYDLNGNGKPQIIVYRIIGASCPGKLDIYESHKGKIEPITGAWANDSGQCQSVEIKDLDNDGHSEIIVKVQNYGVNPDIYRWDRTQYVKSNDKFPQYYDNDLAKLIQEIYAKEEVPAADRVMWCKQAVEIYLLQHRYTEAIQLCNETIRIIDDPKLTIPNRIIRKEDSPEEKAQIITSFEREKAEEKAKIHRLLGNIYKASGDTRQTESQYLEAQH